MRLAHPPHGLGFCELVVHFRLAAGIVFGQVVVDKWRMYPSGRDAVATNVMSDVVFGHGKGHGDDSAFAGAVGEAITETCTTRDGGNVDDGATAVRLEMAHTSVNAV